MVAMADETDDGNAEETAQFPEGFRQDGGCSAKGIACLGIDYGNVSVLNGLPKLPDKTDVAREFPLADTSDLPHEPGPPDKAVNGDDIVCPFRENRAGQNLEVDEGVVVTQNYVRRLDSLHAGFPDYAFVLPHGRKTEKDSKRTEIPAGSLGRLVHVESPEYFFH